MVLRSGGHHINGNTAVGPAGNGGSGENPPGNDQNHQNDHKDHKGNFSGITIARKKFGDLFEGTGRIAGCFPSIVNLRDSVPASNRHITEAAGAVGLDKTVNPDSHSAAQDRRDESEFLRHRKDISSLCLTPWSLI